MIPSLFTGTAATNARFGDTAQALIPRPATARTCSSRVSPDHSRSVPCLSPVAINSPPFESAQHENDTSSTEKEMRSEADGSSTSRKTVPAATTANGSTGLVAQWASPPSTWRETSSARVWLSLMCTVPLRVPVTRNSELQSNAQLTTRSSASLILASSTPVRVFQSLTESSLTLQSQTPFGASAHTRTPSCRSVLTRTSASRNSVRVRNQGRAPGTLRRSRSGARRSSTGLPSHCSRLWNCCHARSGCPARMWASRRSARANASRTAGCRSRVGVSAGVMSHPSGRCGWQSA